MYFKGLNDETREDFEDRIRDAFNMYVETQIDSGIEVPEVPSSCATSVEVAIDLVDAITLIENEETFLIWLNVNLEACCDGLLEDTNEYIEES